MHLAVLTLKRSVHPYCKEKKKSQILNRSMQIHFIYFFHIDLRYLLSISTALVVILVMLNHQCKQFLLLKYFVIRLLRIAMLFG